MKPSYRMPCGCYTDDQDQRYADAIVGSTDAWVNLAPRPIMYGYVWVRDVFLNDQCKPYEKGDYYLVKLGELWCDCRAG